jgi:hypothetical protein
MMGNGKLKGGQNTHKSDDDDDYCGNWFCQFCDLATIIYRKV